EYFELVNTAGESVIAPNQANGISIEWPTSILSDTTRIEAGESYKFPGTIAVLNPVELMDLATSLFTVYDDVNAGGGGTLPPLGISFGSGLTSGGGGELAGGGAGGSEAEKEKEDIIQQCLDGGNVMAVTVNRRGVPNRGEIGENLQGAHVHNGVHKIFLKISNCEGHVDEQGEPKDITIHLVELSSNSGIFSPADFSTPRTIVPGGSASGSIPVNVNQMVQDSVYTARVTISSTEEPYSFDLNVVKDEEGLTGKLTIPDNEFLLDPGSGVVTVQKDVSFQNTGDRTITLTPTFSVNFSQETIATKLESKVTLLGVNDSGYLEIAPGETKNIAVMDINYDPKNATPGDFSGDLIATDTEGQSYKASFSGKVSCDDQFSLIGDNGSEIDVDGSDPTWELDLPDEDLFSIISLRFQSKGAPLNISSVTWVPDDNLPSDILEIAQNQTSHTIKPGNDGVLQLRVKTEGLAGQEIMGYLVFNHDRPDCFPLTTLLVKIKVTGDGNGSWELKLTDTDDQPVPDEGVRIQRDLDNIKEEGFKVSLDNRSNSDVIVKSGGFPDVFLDNITAPPGVTFSFVPKEDVIDLQTKQIVAAANEVTKMGRVVVTVAKNAKIGDFKVDLNVIDAQGKQKTETLKGRILSVSPFDYTFTYKKDSNDEIDLCEDQVEGCHMKIIGYNGPDDLDNRIFTFLAYPTQPVDTEKRVWVYGSTNTSNVDFEITSIGGNNSLFEGNSPEPPTVGAIGNFMQKNNDPIPIQLKITPDNPEDIEFSGNFNLIFKDSDNTVLGKLRINVEILNQPNLSYKLGYNNSNFSGFKSGDVIPLPHVDLYEKESRYQEALIFANRSLSTNTIISGTPVVQRMYFKSSANGVCPNSNIFQIGEPESGVPVCSWEGVNPILGLEPYGNPIQRILYNAAQAPPGEYSDVLVVEYKTLGDLASDALTTILIGEPETYTVSYELNATVHMRDANAPLASISTLSPDGTHNPVNIGSRYTLRNLIEEIFTISNEGGGSEPLEININIFSISNSKSLSYQLSDTTLSIPPGGEATFSITNVSASCDPDQLGYVEIITNDPL
ncbi:hypothetical protein, partial [Leptobacterium sp. I13]|uniref:COG1470 family protein n=1 Tax=Leptobacterium meishanense TaxID=3128904 RepID=UPI0030EE5B81